MTPTAQIVTVDVVDTVRAAAAVESVLDDAGLGVAARLSVVDDEAVLEHGLRAEVALTVVVTSSQSLDLVRHAVARAAGASLGVDERMPAAQGPATREQAALLSRASVVWEMPGGRPGWMLEHEGRVLVVLPEASLQPLLDRHVRPFVTTRWPSAGGRVARALRCAGLTLAEIETRLGDLLDGDSETRITTSGADGDVHVRLRSRRGGTEAARRLAIVESRVMALLGEACYGRGGETLEHVLGPLLQARGLMLATAESCTGGLVGHRLTSVPGSSAWFERGVVVYSNRAKQDLLGVPDSILREHGAVSAPCAEAMVRGICQAAGAACGVSITGIAGPDGGTPAKPVGTVFIGVAVCGDVTAHHFLFAGDRASIKWQSSQMALDLLRRRLQGAGPPA